MRADAHLVAGDEDRGWRRAWSVGDGGALRGGLGGQMMGQRIVTFGQRVQQRQTARCSEQPRGSADLTVVSTDIVSPFCFAFDEISHSLNN